MNVEGLAEAANETAVLIDTWWNVNEEIKSDVKIDDTVLIDTWWNVNAAPVAASYFPVSVLIDTWWNVNFYIALWLLSPSQF